MLQAVLPPRSNKASWVQEIEVRDDETSELIDLTGHDIRVEVRRQDCSGTVLQATIDLGNVVILDVGVFQFEFTVEQMRGLCPDTYEIGALIEFDDETTQLLIGSLSILDGIVRST